MKTALFLAAVALAMAAAPLRAEGLDEDRTPVRLSIRMFFLLVALQRVLPIAPRGPRTPLEERG